MNPETLTPEQRILWLAEREADCHHDKELAWDVPGVADRCEDCHGTGKVPRYPSLRRECGCTVVYCPGWVPVSGDAALRALLDAALVDFGVEFDRDPDGVCLKRRDCPHFRQPGDEDTECYEASCFFAALGQPIEALSLALYRADLAKPEGEA